MRPKFDENTESEAVPTLIRPWSRSKSRQLPCADVVASLGVLAPLRIDQSFASGSTVFIAVDDLTVRRDLQAACNELGIYHVSVGIGVEVEGESNDQLGGNVKVETAFRPRQPRPREVPPEERPDQAYGIVQTAELNMLGAALAVVEWKARVGVYRNDRPHDMDTVLVSASTGRLLQDRKGDSPA